MTDDLFYSSDTIGFDRQPAVILWAPSWDREIEPKAFANRIQKLIQLSLDEARIEIPLYPNARHHQIGSAAEWSRTIALVFDVTGPIAEYLANLVVIGQAAIQIVKTVRENDRAEAQNHNDDTSGLPPIVYPPILSLPTVIGIAANDYRSKYGPLEGIQVLWNVRSSDVSARVEEPTGRETFTVVFESSGERIVYSISSEGRCLEHLVVSGNRVLAVDLPNFLGDNEWERVRQIGSGLIDKLNQQ